MLNDNNEPVVGLFVKEPRPKHVMTRLGKDIGMQNAATFYGECVAVLYERLMERDVDTVLFPASEESIGFFRRSLEMSSDELVQIQSGENLGERMFNALLFLRNKYDQLPIILGSDAPLLPVKRIKQTVHHERSNDVILGPAKDGGYYLIATRKPKMKMFKNIVWSQPDVLDETIDRLSELGFNYELLPKWNDIDSLEDLIEKGDRFS